MEFHFIITICKPRGGPIFTTQSGKVISEPGQTRGDLLTIITKYAAEKIGATRENDCYVVFFDLAPNMLPTAA